MAYINTGWDPRVTADYQNWLHGSKDALEMEECKERLLAL